MTKPFTRKVKLELRLLLTDPLQYKPFSPHLAPAEGQKVIVEFDVPKGRFKRSAEGDITLDTKGFQALLKEVGRTIYDIELTRVD